MRPQVIVGMSGGVDSSVAAYLLLEQGYDVSGLFMKNWEHDDQPEHCPAAEDLADAQSVCDHLNIQLNHVNFSNEYWHKVFEHFLNEYQQARTPNPDVLCNKEIKFKSFLNHAINLGADYIATGHYANVKHYADLGLLYKAKDRNKDQTYFLHAVDPQALAKTLFPLGGYLKTEVRKIAAQLNLTTHAKKDSTGICFIGEKRFKPFLNEFILAKPGDIITTNGVVIAKHDGLMFYTLGQRQGLGIGGTRAADQSPWYVVDKDISTNTLIVAQGAQHPRLYAQGLICGPIHWLVDIKKYSLPLTCYAKTRYRQQDQACMISPADQDKHYVLFSTAQRAITPGQYVVFYDKNQCIGGATIEQIIR